MIDDVLEKDYYLKEKDIKVVEYDVMLRYFGGDVWKLYNILELVINFDEEGILEIINEFVIEKV